MPKDRQDDPEDGATDAADSAAEDADALYAVAPDGFVAARTERVRAAKQDGDAARARAIGRLRRPTVSAWVVNRAALTDPELPGRLSELGDRMRRAQSALDTETLRDLTEERRRTVDEVTSAALRDAGQDATTSLRDEVRSTFDAAVADPDVAGRLGRLLRAESFSGFGVAPGPELTVVRGGRAARARPAARQTPREAAPTKEPAADRVGAAERRRLARAVERARAEFDQARRRDEDTATAEQRAAATVKELTAELASLQRELDDAKRAQDEARRERKDAIQQRRSAQSALDRAERAAAQD